MTALFKAAGITGGIAVAMILQAVSRACPAGFRGERR